MKIRFVIIDILTLLVGLHSDDEEVDGFNTDDSNSDADTMQKEKKQITCHLHFSGTIVEKRSNTDQVSEKLEARKLWQI